MMKWLLNLFCAHRWFIDEVEYHDYRGMNVGSTEHLRCEKCGKCCKSHRMYNDKTEIF